jgi:hypothetical protein
MVMSRTGTKFKLPVATTAPVLNIINVPGTNNPTKARDSVKDTKKIIT